MSQNLESWWTGLGPIARFTLMLSSALSISCSLGWVHPYAYIADWNAICYKREYWRCLSSLFFLGRVDMSFLWSLFLFVEHQKRLEIEFKKAPADLLYLNILIAIGVLMGSYFTSILVPSYAFLLSLIWVWSRIHATERVTIYYFNIEAQYYPLVLMAMNYLMNGEYISSIVACLVGHTYYLSKFILPKKRGINALVTPHILREISSYMFYSPKQGASKLPSQNSVAYFRHWFSRGQRLGTNLSK